MSHAQSDQAPTAAAPEALPYLSRAYLDGLAVGTDEVVGAIERAVAERAEGRLWAAPKSVVMPGDERYVMATLALAEEPRVLAVKSLVLNPRNPPRGLPEINALVTLLDAETGVPLAVVDGNWVTALRTAGLSAAAARRLARPDSASIGFVGCGVQARSHLAAFCDLFPVREIFAFGRGSKNRDALCREAEARGLEATAAPTARDAVADADLIVTSVTFSPQLEPFLDARWVKAGSFAAVTDLAAPWKPEGMTGFGRIVVDDLEQERQMAKPLVDPALVAGDLTGLVCGGLEGRQSPEQRTAFVFRGLALGDLALAALAWQRFDAG